jgi:hypothetical protein
MRLSLVAIDMVQPYVAWTVLPSAGSQATSAAAGAGAVEVGWDVGGAMSVDAVEVLVGLWPDAADFEVPISGAAVGGFAGRSYQDVIGGDWLKQYSGNDGARVLWRSGFAGTAAEVAPAGSGNVGEPAQLASWLIPRAKKGSFPAATQWREGGSRLNGTPGFATLISANVRVPTTAELTALGVTNELLRFSKGGRTGSRCCFVMMRAKVDSAWTKNPGAKPANTPPQSHVVNARTNNNWLKTNKEAKRTVRGRLWYYSSPKQIAGAGVASVGAASAAHLHKLGRGNIDFKQHLVLASRAGGGAAGVVLPQPMTVPELARGMNDPPMGSMKQGYLTEPELYAYLATQKTIFERGLNDANSASASWEKHLNDAKKPVWSWHTIGKSAGGKPIKALCIGQCLSKSRPFAPSALYTGLLHAREPMGAMVIATFVAFVAHATMRHDPSTRALLNSRQLWFVPVLNPDGYEYNHRNPRADVRKNR